MEAADLTFHLLGEEHIDGALQLCRLAGWNQTAHDWQRLLRLEPAGCFAVSSDSQLIGTVTTTCYQQRLAWIGMMLVHPDFRRRGLATELITRSLDYLREKGTRCIKLDATPAGRTVYAPMGFQVEWSFHRWILEKDNIPFEAAVEQIPREPAPRSAFSAEALQLDINAFGADRSELLLDLSPATLCRYSTAAYGLLRTGYLADYLGPVVATTVDAANHIINELVTATDRTIFWDIPSPNQAAMGLAKSLGFQPTRELIRMQIHEQAPAPNYAWQYAMFDPSVG